MAEIASREDFERWLDGKPREVAITLAARCALRVIPGWQVLLGKIDGRTRASILLPVFRASASALTTAIGPTSAAEVSEAKRSALAVRSAANSFYPEARLSARGHSALNTAAAAAAMDVTAHMAAAKHAATATNPGDIWDALSADCTMPERRKEGATPAAARDLAMRPLWPVPDWREKRDIFHRGRWQSGIPAWARDGEAALFAALERHPGEHWDVWARWYRDRVRGKPLTRSDREFLEAMVLLDRENGFAAWQHPAEINARIRELEARGPEPRRPRLPADRQSPVNFVFRGAVIDRAPPPPPAVPDTRRAELESARRALAGLFDDTLGGPISNREPRLGTVLQRCREALGRDLGTLEPVALGIVADRLNGYAARADALLLPELAAEVVSLNAQTALFLAQFAEWRDYARAMETALGAEAAELAAVAEATEAVGAIIGAEPALLTEPAAGALALLGEEAAADPAPLVRRSYLRAVRAFALTLAARAVEAVGAGAEIGVRNTAAAAVMAGAAYLGTLATGLPAEFGWLNAVIAWVGRWLR